MNSNRIKYSVNNVYINTFYQMPKFLVQNEEFNSLSYGAKFLYMLLKDRHELSLSNKWYDENGFIYLIYTREDMTKMMNVSKNTTTKFMNELKEFELIEEKKMGRGMPNRIYLLAINVENTTKYKNPKICDSRVTKNGILESQNLTPNNTNINNTNFNNQSIYPEEACPQEEISLTSDEEQIDGLIKRNIGYNEFKNTYPEIEDIYKLILDTFTSGKKTMKINKSQIPIEEIRNRYLSLNSMHIEYVLECVTKQPDIKNIRSYLLTALYNAPTTINSFYSNKVKNLLDNS